MKTWNVTVDGSNGFLGQVHEHALDDGTIEHVALGSDATIHNPKGDPLLIMQMLNSLRQMQFKPWAMVPRDGSVVLPWHGQTSCGSNGYAPPVSWFDDNGEMYWVNDSLGIEEGLDDIAQAFLLLPDLPKF